VLCYITSSATELTNTAYGILKVLGKDADFLYDTIETYIQDACLYANNFDAINGYSCLGITLDFSQPHIELCYIAALVRALISSQLDMTKYLFMKDG
jgi:hypothetical protein